MEFREISVVHSVVYKERERERKRGRGTETRMIS